jgi:hypothetical protein
VQGKKIHMQEKKYIELRFPAVEDRIADIL